MTNASGFNLHLMQTVACQPRTEERTLSKVGPETITILQIQIPAIAQNPKVPRRFTNKSENNW